MYILQNGYLCDSHWPWATPHQRYCPNQHNMQLALPPRYCQYHVGVSIFCQYHVDISIFCQYHVDISIYRQYNVDVSIYCRYHVGVSFFYQYRVDDSITSDFGFHYHWMRRTRVITAWGKCLSKRMSVGKI